MTMEKRNPDAMNIEQRLNLFSHARRQNFNVNSMCCAFHWMRAQRITMFQYEKSYLIFVLNSLYILTFYMVWHSLTHNTISHKYVCNFIGIEMKWNAELFECVCCFLLTLEKHVARTFKYNTNISRTLFCQYVIFKCDSITHRPK